MSEASEPPYRLQVARPAARAIANELPEPVAAAVVEFVTGDFLRAPRMVGKPLQREPLGRWAARRGTYRVLYAIDDHDGVITVLAAEHRRDVYRRR
ncbi:MAG: type II toxin-antitoxin system RelE family toxin [Acidimicrobiales bacterium]